MKKRLILTALFVQSLCVFAQKQNLSIVDCHYSLTFKKDTVDNVIAEDVMILRTNRTKSIFFSQETHYFDSLNMSESGKSFVNLLIQLRGKFEKIETYNVIKDQASKTMTFADDIGAKHVVYQEPFPQFNWKISNETKKVRDHLCQKATCKFRGRSYIAWFTTEIPLKDGPWKFNGLPGLILEVYDTKNQYHFKFMGMHRNKADISLLPYDYEKTTRAEYLKNFKEHLENPAGNTRKKLRRTSKFKTDMKAKDNRRNPMELY